MPFKKENSVSSIGKESEGTEDIDLSPRLTQLTEQHKKAIRAIRKIRYFVSRRKFREARRPYDVKDVIEQYSAGHVDMLGRIKNLQGRLDQILGRQGSKSKDVYESKICLASRIVKVERQVDDIETKVDLLVDMYKEDRKFLLTHIQHIYGGNPPPTDPPRIPQAPPPSGGSSSSEASAPGKKSLSGFKPRPILIDKQFTSEPATPTGFLTNAGGANAAGSSRLGARPSIQRNLSDLSQRIKKRVTYRGLSQHQHDPPSRAQSAACFPVSSLPPPPSPSPTSSAADCVFVTDDASEDNQDAVSPPSFAEMTHQHGQQADLVPVTTSAVSNTSNQNGTSISPVLPPKLPPPVPNTVSSTSPILSNRTSLQHPGAYVNPSTTTNSPFHYPSGNSALISAIDHSAGDGTQETSLTSPPSPFQTSQISYDGSEDNHENLISFTYDNGESSRCQGHFDAVHFAKEPQQHANQGHTALQRPVLGENVRPLPHQQPPHAHFKQQQQQQQHAPPGQHPQHPLSHHHHQHHHPGSMLSSLIGTSLATVTEQRSTDSDSGQYLSDTCHSSPSRLPTSSAGQTDDEGAETDSKGYPSPGHRGNLTLSGLEPLPPATDVETLTSDPDTLSGRPLSPPQCSADSVCSETSSVHDDEMVPFLAAENQQQATRPQSCDTSCSSRVGLPRQSSEALTSPSTTSSQASLLTDSRSHIARGNSQSNASFSPDAPFDERDTPLARGNAGSVS